MEEKSNTTKSFKRECEEDIKYIQSGIDPCFQFDIPSSEIAPDAQRSYYSQLHGLLSAYISISKLKNLEQVLISYIDNEVQLPEDTIRCIGEHCKLKTLGIEEQFAVFQLLNEDNIRTLLELSMANCDTYKYQDLLDLFSCDDFKKFKVQVGNINYSASRVSRVAQAICIHSESISEFFYDHTLKSILGRIKSYNVDFEPNQLLTTIFDYYSSAHILGMLPMLLGMNYGPITSYINSFVIDYGYFRAANHSKKPIPSTLAELLSRMMVFRKKMLEQYISVEADKLKGKHQEERPHVTTPPASQSKKSPSLTNKPTNITTIEDIDAFCKAFSSYCYPNDPTVVKSFFWNTAVDKFPEQIKWKSTKKMFVAFIHYAYRERDLPMGTETLVKEIFYWKDKPLDIAGYGQDKYSDCYTQVETQISLVRQGLLE